METLAVVNQKGGVGKTTTAVTCAHGLALAGLQVLVVDLDAQGNVADSLGLEKWGGLYRMLMGDNTCIIESGRDGLDCLLGDKRTVEAKQILAGRDFREYALKEALAQMPYTYDVVILDVAPGVDLLQVNALVACTMFIIPVSLSHLALVGAGDALASAAALRQGAMGGQFLGILPIMWERQTNESHEQLQTLARQYGKWVWPPIPVDVKARECTAYGKTLWEYAPGCRALEGVEIRGEMVGGYRKVVERLRGEL